MTTFGDFALLRAVPSYGGAEVLLARRVLEGAGPGGEGRRVHVALYGTANARRLAGRIADVAEVAAGMLHEQVARVHEVGLVDGALYAVADPEEGIDLASIIEHERRRKAVPDLAVSLAVALQLGQLGLELTERSDVWAAAGGNGLSSLFPAGLRLDAVVVRRDGKVAVRVLAGAAADPARPSAFRAPEHQRDGASAASDVFVVAQVLRALVSGDASATSAPRLTPPASTLLGPLLAGGLAGSPDERLGLFMFLEKLARALASAQPDDKRQKPVVVVTRAFQAWHPHLGADEEEEPPSAEALRALRTRLKQVRASMDVVGPRRAASATGGDDATTGSPPAPGTGSALSDVFFVDGAVADERTPNAPTAVTHTVVEHSDRSDAVDRVFTAEGDADTLELTPRRKRAPPAAQPSSTSLPATRAARSGSGSRGGADESPLLEFSSGEEPTTQKIKKASGGPDLTDSEPPWESDVALIESNSGQPAKPPPALPRPHLPNMPSQSLEIVRVIESALAAPGSREETERAPPAPVAGNAPTFSVDDIEAGPTVQTTLDFGDDDKRGTPPGAVSINLDDDDDLDNSFDDISDDEKTV